MPGYSNLRERLELKEDEGITQKKLQAYSDGCIESENRLLDHLQRVMRLNDDKRAVRGVGTKWLIILMSQIAWRDLLSRWPEKTCKICSKDEIIVKNVDKSPKGGRLQYRVECGACKAFYYSQGV